MTSDPVSRYLDQRGAKFSRKTRMRVMASSEVLDAALRVYQRHGLTFLRVTAAPALLCLAAVGFLQNYVIPDLFLTKSNAGPAQLIQDVGGALVTGVFLGGPVFLIAVSYASAIVVHLVSDFMLGNVADPAAAVATARRLLPRLFLVNLKELGLSLSGILVATAVMVLGGYLTSVTPDTDVTAGAIAFIGVLGFIAGLGIFLYIVAFDALAVPIAVLEGAGTRNASKRSRYLLRKAGYHPSGTGAIWAVYALLIYISIVIGSGSYFFLSTLSLNDRLKSMLAFVPAEEVLLRAIDLVPSYFVIWTLTPVWATVITLVYYERRIRLEGFDIDVLAMEISKPADASTSVL